MKLAEKLALTDPGLSFSIEELALKNGVQERTLRRAFQRYYDLSPIEYLRLRRLHHARRLLMVGCPDRTTVTKIAFELGFWDLGRFAGAYRQLFGELPSETFRKSVRVPIGVRPDQAQSSKAQSLMTRSGVELRFL